MPDRSDWQRGEHAGTDEDRTSPADVSFGEARQLTDLGRRERHEPAPTRTFANSASQRERHKTSGRRQVLRTQPD